MKDDLKVKVFYVKKILDEVKGSYSRRKNKSSQTIIH